ncbi:MAG: UvrD-helicase domain-containing protein [Bacteroidetes bacterium]|nr:UvrD-helicase domain-containing protein [Bacteroidota bacterium]
MTHQLTPYQIEALNYKRHIALTANAGSGKTFVLSKRYVEIALIEDVPINKIVAITFTDKAAGELYKKIAGEIEERLISEKDQRIKTKLERIRKQLVSSNISTIHSFCIDLLREFSPDAGIDANFSPIDSETSDELIELSIEEVIINLLKEETQSDKIKYLVRILGSKAALTSQLKHLIHQRKNLIKLADTLYSGNVEVIAKHFKSEFHNKFILFFSENIELYFSNLAKLNNEIIFNEPGDSIALTVRSILDKYTLPINPLEILSAVHRLGEVIFTQKNELRKKEFTKKFDSQNFVNEIKEIEKIQKVLRSFKIDENFESANIELAKFGKSILEVFNRSAVLYDEKKSDKGYLDFEDILLHTKNIVSQESVREKLSAKYNYIMLDEYQDTNEIQYEIFMPILENLNAGNLFVVGDEKQSIYMFRDADLEIFNRTKNEIEKKETALSLLQLPHSFRMSPPIAAFTNELFKELFRNPKIEFNEVTPNELICSKEEDVPGQIEILAADSDTESEMVSKRILKLLNNSEETEINFKDIAVLCRKRNAFSELEKSFSKYKIPFTIIGGKGYYQRQIIYDIYNYLSFLINPDNDSALVGILRSPFFTISDANIYEISLCKGKTFFEKFKDFNVSNKTFQYILNLLTEHLSYALKVDLAFLLRKILNDTAYWSVIASKPNSAQEIANLNKLLRISNSFLQQGLKTIYDFVNYLAEAMEKLADEGQAAVSKDENTVKIMTIHQSKGLEFKAVFLFKCGDYSKDENVRAKSISVDKQFGILTKVPLNGNYFDEYSMPPIAGIYNYQMNKKLNAEAKRLLYVAVTRAINYLFISFSVNSKKADSSFLSFICEGLNINLEDENHNINSRLKFMSSFEKQYEIYEKDVRLVIPVIKSIEDFEEIKERDNEVLPDDKIITTGVIIDRVKNEIISATKSAMFLQCPLKYKLTYDLGYTKILKIFDKQIPTFEFKYNEDEETNDLADLRGRVIHSLLEKEVKLEEINNLVSLLVIAEIETKQPKYKNREKLIRSITEELSNYYSSSTFSLIKTYTDFQNEFEIYSKENDYYLYGIIDKLIIDGNRVIIIDYKTDNISPEKIEERGNNYLPQLKFYSLLASKMFPDKKEIVCRLVFIKHPENIFEKVITDNEIINFKEELNLIVKNIRLNNFPPNLSHCQVCHFALNNGKCIIANS